MHALQKRQLHTTLRVDRQPHGSGSCQAEPKLPCSIDEFSILQVNVRGFVSHRASLESYADALSPSLIALSETFLDSSYGAVTLANYRLISRLDRRTGCNCGGILVFVRWDVADFVVHIGDSDVHERSWHILYSQSGPILFRLWYRPPRYNEVVSITDLDSELQHFGTSAIGTILVGDMNVHHKTWLQFSSTISPEGRALFTAASRHGLTQRVCQPTRGKYLLDLVLTDLDDYASTQVLPGISDHCMVLSRVALPIPSNRLVYRPCFHLKDANWPALKNDLNEVNWRAILSNDDPHQAAKLFTDTVTSIAKVHIPFEQKLVSKSSHPWLNEHCRKLLLLKIEALGTPSFAQLQRDWAEAVNLAAKRYTSKLKSRLCKLPSFSKKWWKLSNELLMKSTVCFSTSQLQLHDGTWITDSAFKAKVFSETFVNKCNLPPAVENEFSELISNGTPKMMSGFLPLRLRHARKFLQTLDPHSSTGPDFLPAAVLKQCSSILALPVVLIARCIL